MAAVVVDMDSKAWVVEWVVVMANREWEVEWVEEDMVSRAVVEVTKTL